MQMNRNSTKDSRVQVENRNTLVIREVLMAFGKATCSVRIAPASTVVPKLVPRSTGN
jgi:hypothetical protein